MDPLAGMFALVVIAMIGTLVLVGIRLRTKGHETRSRISDDDFDRLVDSVDALTDQVRLLTEETAELGERVDFAERLLTRGERRENRSPTPT